MLHDSQEWGGKGLGMPKRSMKRGVGCSMVHKSGVGKAWEGSKWFPRVLWEWFGKSKKRSMQTTLKMKHEKGFGCFMTPKSGVGRVWECQNEA